jgi:hypothetical protein
VSVGINALCQLFRIWAAVGPAHPGKSLRKKTATQKEGSEDACRNAGKNSKPEAKLAYALGPLGNVFLLATLSELRRHRLTYLAFYALQRSIDEADQESDRPYSERRLRTESQ